MSFLKSIVRKEENSRNETEAPAQDNPVLKRNGHRLFDHSLFPDAAILTVRDQEFTVSKSYLALHSPYFFDLLYGPKSTKNQHEFQLDCDPLIFGDLLDMIYPCYKHTDCCVDCSISRDDRVNLARRLGLEFAVKRLMPSEDYTPNPLCVTDKFPDSTIVNVRGVPVAVSASSLSLHSSFLVELLYQRGRLVKNLTIYTVSHEAFLLFLQSTIGKFPAECTSEFLDTLLKLGARGIYDFYLPQVTRKMLVMSSEEAAPCAMQLFEHYSHQPNIDMAKIKDAASYLSRNQLEKVFSKCPTLSPNTKEDLIRHVESVKEAAIVLVYFPTGKYTDLVLPRGIHTSVFEAKIRYQMETDIPTDQQRWIFKGRQFEDGRSLADYDVTPNATIHVLLRLRGC